MPDVPNRAISATTAAAVPGSVGRSRRNHQEAPTPIATSRAPMRRTIIRTGITATRTKPVMNVPARAPAVPAAESPPTTAPVSSTEPSTSLATIGLTALTTAAGSRNAAATSSTVEDAVVSTAGPSDRTIGTDSQLSTPPATIVGPIRRAGSMRSASRPPTAAPTAIPANTVPMMAVNDSSEMPT